MLLFATRSFAKAHNLPFLEIPAEIPSMEYFLIWHKSDEGRWWSYLDERTNY
jgi:hypothetical protein